MANHDSSRIIPNFMQLCPVGAWKRALLIAGLFLICGCGGQDTGHGDPLLEDLDCSELLEPYLSAASHSLEDLPTDPGATRGALTRYDAICQNLENPALESVAADSFFSAWKDQPGSVLYPSLAASRGSVMGRDPRSEAMFERPVCSDTTTALGRYIRGWRAFNYTAFRTDFLAAFQQCGAPDSLTDIWIGKDAVFTLRSLNELDQALEMALDLVTPARRVGGPSLEARIWTEIAEIRKAQFELEDALFAVSLAERQFVATTRDGGPILPLLRVRKLKADILADLLLIEPALALYESNAEAATALDLNFPAAANFNSAGMQAEVAGDRERSIDYLRRSLDVLLADGDAINVAGIMMNIADRYRKSGRLDSCLVYHRRAEPWVARSRFPMLAMRYALMRAEYYTQIGRFDVVDSLFDVASNMENATPTVSMMAELHLEMIRGWMETGRPDLVYRSIAKVNELRPKLANVAGDRNDPADLDLLIAEFLTRRGDFARAAAALDRADEALAKKPSPERSWTLAHHRGRLARARGSLQAAEDDFRECIRLGIELETPELESTGRFLLGSVLLERGDFADARSAFPATDEKDFQGRFVTRVSALLLIGISHLREGNPDRALEVFAEARSACYPWSPTHLLARLDLETGRAQAAQGQLGEARRRYREASERLLAQVGKDQARATPELAYFNGDLRRDLVEAMIELPGIDPGKSLQMARRVLPHWQATDRSDDFAASPVLAPQLIFFVGTESSGCWSVDSAGVSWRDLPGLAGLRSLLGPALADLNSPARTPNPGMLERIGKLLLGDIADTWQPGQILRIVPDLDLHRIPWVALPVSPRGETVLDHGPILVLSSPAVESTQDHLRIRHRPGGRLLVLGANGAASELPHELQQLEFAESEAREVYAVWPAGRAVLRTGSEVAQVLSGTRPLAGFDTIHIASHTQAVGGGANEMRLLIAGADGEPVSASSLKSQNFDTELVYLSSCESSAGLGARSGPAGLANAFLSAGARCVIASTHLVDDEAAQALAIRFHRHWLAGESAPVALNAAQREIRAARQEWEHPFYWGSQQVVGTSRRPRQN